MQNQDNRRAELMSLLGDLPPINREISAKKLFEIDKGSYTLEILSLDLNGIEPVSAYFAKPKGSHKTPCVIYNHAYDFFMGKDELINGRPALKSPYVNDLIDLGYSVLAIDHWMCGDRRGRSESSLFKDMLWNGKVLWGMMVYDSLKAVEYLTHREDVDSTRLATLGLSMGSTMGWWVSALNTKIKVCVDLCCMTDFDEAVYTNGFDFHNIYYFVPNLLKHFTTTDIISLIAPRAHISLNGIYDVLTPGRGLEKIDENLKKVYSEMGADDNWKMKNYNIGHIETFEMRYEILQFLKAKL